VAVATETVAIIGLVLVLLKAIIAIAWGASKFNSAVKRLEGKLTEVIAGMKETVTHLHGVDRRVGRLEEQADSLRRDHDKLEERVEEVL
jgi:chromosome segregation ATPase